MKIENAGLDSPLEPAAGKNRLNDDAPQTREPGWA